ncbi:hypothetical protein CPC08DRAFT_433151 [Agrocybe pediades]|nr:hypothetical protein CPC08DRAFT_433151 [Agrocybe pediades]
MFEQASIRLALTCWLYSVPCHKNISHNYASQQTAGLISNFFVHVDKQGRSPPDNYLEIAFQAFDVGTFVSRLTLILQSELEVIDANILALEIIASTVFLRHPSYYAHIVGARIHVQILESVKTVLMNLAIDKVICESQNKTVHAANPGESGPVYFLLDCSGIFFRILFERSSVTDGDLVLNLIGDTPLMEICAAALQLLNRKNCMAKASNSPWIDILTMVSRYLTESRKSPPVADGLRHYVFVQELLKAVKIIIGSIASPVLHSLKSEACVSQCSNVPHSDYADIWKGLLDRVGITEESIRGSYKEQKKCCNAQCPYRRFETCLLMMPKKSRCTGCRTAFYCDRECQTMDWKNHKKECKKMRKASAQ